MRRWVLGIAGRLVIAVAVVFGLLVLIGAISTMVGGGIGTGIGILLAGANLSFWTAVLGRVMVRRSRNRPFTGRIPAGAPSGVAAGVRYTEAFCQVSALGLAIAVPWLAGSIWLLAAIPGFSNPGPQGLLIMIPVIPGFYLLCVLLYLPHQIVVRGGWMRLGARGVPPWGWLWRRELIPLEAITAWDVLPARAFKARKSQYMEASDGPFGAMRGPGVRYVLWVEADPSRVRDSAPETMLRGQAVVDVASRGWVNGGRVVIGTRRPKRLAATLEAALPGRRVSR